MQRTQRPDWLAAKMFRGVLLCALVAVAGCGDDKPKSKAPVLANRYQSLPLKNVPPFLKNSIIERCELSNAEPMPVSSFGLVSNLQGTGDSFAGQNVVQFIRREMINHGFGSAQHGLENMQPEDILKDPRFAIVRVDGFIPPGAHRHQRFDVAASVFPGNNTSSLAHGALYRTDLKVNGANVQAPGYTIDIWAAAEGSLFVNPAYALDANISAPEARASLSRAVIPDGGVVLIDRPLSLRVRQPQLSLARAIENRIDQAYQDTQTAAARDEAIINIVVPEKYGTDWEHFAQVVMHLFINSSPEFSTLKARELVEEADKPDAPLLDISYCWEGLGPTIIPFITPLMTSPKPDVAFAAARAAAFLGEGAAQDVLMRMASNSSHPFQINAVQTLGKLPSSPVINQALRQLLDCDQTLVRLEAYRALASHEDPYIRSQPIDDKFILDIVQCQGPPIIYASRTGTPRIAVIGNKPRLNVPMMFSAMNNRLTISSDQDRLVTVFYRGPDVDGPVRFLSPPEADQLIARLGGEGAPGDKRLQFNYCDVVALLQQIADQKHLVAPSGSRSDAVTFVLQEAPYVEQQAQEAPAIADEPQPDSIKADNAMNALKDYSGMK